MDIKGAYLNANLDGRSSWHNCRILCAWKGKPCMSTFQRLKQSGRRWYKCICEAFSNTSICEMWVEHCVFFKWIGLSFIVVMVAMNDLTLASNSASPPSWNQGSAQCKVANSRWQIWVTYHWLLGIKVKCNHWELTISLLQCVYIDTILASSSHGCQHCKCSHELDLHLSQGHSPSTTTEKAEMVGVPYHEVVDSLMYAALGTCPKLLLPLWLYPNSYRILERSNGKWSSAFFRYLKGRHNIELTFGREPTGFVAYSNANLPSQEHCHSISDYVYS